MVPGAFWGPSPEADEGVGWSLGRLEELGALFGMVEIGAAGVGFVDLDDVEGFADVHGGGGSGGRVETILGIVTVHLHNLGPSKSTGGERSRVSLALCESLYIGLVQHILCGIRKSPGHLSMACASRSRLERLYRISNPFHPLLLLYPKTIYQSFSNPVLFSK